MDSEIPKKVERTTAISDHGREKNGCLVAVVSGSGSGGGDDDCGGGLCCC